MVDPALVLTWLQGWCLARQVPPPVALRDCWRVDVGLPDQKTRYVFPAASPEIARLARAVSEPFVYIKALLTVEQLARELPPAWRLDPPRFMMRRAALDSAPALLPPPYRLEVRPDAPVPDARILTATGEVAASGQVTRVGEYAIFNVIQTEPAHRRRGLGRAVMRALDGVAREKCARQGMLMATEEGHALYESLGWQVISPYASAVIPDIQRRNQEAKA